MLSVDQVNCVKCAYGIGSGRLRSVVEIVPDGGSEIDRELSRVSKGFVIHLIATVEEERIHDVTEEMN